MMPFSPPINENTKNGQRCDPDPLADKIDNSRDPDFYGLALRVSVFLWLWMIDTTQFHLDLIHEKTKPKAPALCPGVTLLAAMIADSYLIDRLTP